MLRSMRMLGVLFFCFNTLSAMQTSSYDVPELTCWSHFVQFAQAQVLFSIQRWRCLLRGSFAQPILPFYMQAKLKKD